LELFGGQKEILAIRHPVNHNDEYCIWQSWEVTFRFVAQTLSECCYQSLLASPSHFLAYQILLAHFCIFIPTQCGRIYSALWTLPNDSQFVNVTKNSSTAVTQCRGPS
jgi:hypothetical protein